MRDPPNGGNDIPASAQHQAAVDDSPEELPVEPQGNLLSPKTSPPLVRSWKYPGTSLAEVVPWFGPEAHSTASAIVEHHDSPRRALSAGALHQSRMAVSRHFPDKASLFSACSAHWPALHPASWRAAAASRNHGYSRSGPAGVGGDPGDGE